MTVLKSTISRRKFLKGIGLAAGATLLASSFSLQAQPTIKVGVVTGLETVFGEGTRNGAQLAIDEINAAGGVKIGNDSRKLELVIGDIKTELDGQLTRSVYQDTASKADAVLGFFRTEAALAIIPDVPRLKKPLLITGATSLITDRVPSDYDNYKYAFRSVIISTYALVVDILRFMGDYVFELVERGVLPNRKVVMINEDLSSGNLFMSLIGPRLGELGFDVLNQFKIAVGTKDLAPVLAQIGGTGAAIGVTFLSDPGLSTTFPATWAQAKTKIALFGINAPLQADPVVQALKGAATGYVIADFSADAPVSTKTKDFFKNYQNRFKIRPVYTAGTTYDSVYLLAEAIRNAGGTEADKVVEALEKTNMIGAGGPISFYSRADFERTKEIKIETKAGTLTFQNTVPAGITNLTLVNPHDTKYGFKQGQGTAFEGVRPVHTQVGALKADNSFDRNLLYPGEFSDKPDDPVSLYQVPPHFKG